MAKNEAGLTVAEMVAQLLKAKPNDVVKLATLSPEALADGLAQLDLSLLDTFERSSTGSVKVKIVDRAALLRALPDGRPPDGDGGGPVIVDDIPGGEEVNEIEN